MLTETAAGALAMTPDEGAPLDRLSDGAVCGERLERGRDARAMHAPLGLGGRSKKINELMINLKIPAAYRSAYPILVGDAGTLWLPGYHVDHRARVTDGTTEVLVVRVERR